MQPTDFSSLPLSSDLKEVVQELGFEKLTPIQAQSIPLLLEGKDLVGQSKTGSGKTVAFSLPILEKIHLEGRALQALILSPTRELCAQVAREIRRLARRHQGLQVLILSGGQPVRPQWEALRKGAHIVVGTPGRVLDHLRRGNLDFDALEFVVLDEADRMLDMGFEEDMEMIMSALPPSRQTVFFSATYPPTINSLSKKYQKNPVHVKIDDPTETAPAIRQVALHADTEEKLPALQRLLQKYQPASAIVFCNLKATVAELSEVLNKMGISNSALHGDLEQRDRDLVMAMFRNGSSRVLIATDVAARGLDVTDLAMVVNYDLPHQADAYIHRIGRTGRAGKSGVAVSFVTSNEASRVLEFKQHPGIQIDYQTKLDLGPEADLQTAQPANEMRTLHISGGRKDKVRPGDILGALTGEAGGLQGSDIGKIEIHDHFAYVAVSAKVAETVVTRLRKGQIKGRKFLIKLIN